ncbi:MAG: 30S ribosomal protein S12 methylthiotransferase RimO [Candidatus Omnitrophica bacterium]|nr:30S ribosomal protein S12 methylthiotransferase RimO [Candidatus Omnitrophota bacterium]
MQKKFSIISLGCFRNQYDSEVVCAQFIKDGYKFIPYEAFLKNDGNSCDTLIINTCGFIDDAKKESIETIKEALSLKKEKRIKNLFVFGCLVQRYRKQLEKFFIDVDRWEGVIEFSPYFNYRKKLWPSFIDFLKISEGCINNCSYCVIPKIKGPLKSKKQEEILKEVKLLDKRNVKELNIIGQDITSWGKDLGGGDFSLATLLKNIVGVAKNIDWIRLLYTHPRHFSDELINVVAGEEKICKYIDLPIQHINDRILKLMNRNITKSEIIALIEKIRKKIPNVVLRTTVIVGFPTETEKEFEELCKFLQEIKFERLGCFMYSRQDNTAAYFLKPQIHYKIKKARFDRVMSLQKQIASQFNQKFIGSTLKVFVEEKEDGIFIGRSQFDAPDIDGIVFLKNNKLKIGKFYNAKIIDAYEYDLVGI